MPALYRIITYTVIVLLIGLIAWAWNRWANTNGARIFAIISLVLLIGFAVLVEYLLPSRPNIPETTGQYYVGRTEFYPGSSKQLSSLLFYPSQNQSRSAPYIEDASVVSNVLGLPRWFFQQFEALDTGIQDNPAPTNTEKPWIIYLHGGMSFPEDQTSLLAELASRGYRVLAPRLNLDIVELGLNVTDGQEFVTAFAKAEETTFPSLISALFDLIDEPGDQWIIDPPSRADEIIVMGHSLGGGLAGSLGAKLQNQGYRILSWINLDGQVLSDFPFVPQLHLSQGLAFDPSTELGAIVLDYKERIEKAHYTSEKSQWFRIPEAGHGTFTDMPYLMRAAGPFSTLLGTNSDVPILIRELVLQFIQAPNDTRNPADFDQALLEEMGS